MEQIRENARRPAEAPTSRLEPLSSPAIIGRRLRTSSSFVLARALTGACRCGRSSLTCGRTAARNAAAAGKPAPPPARRSPGHRGSPPRSLDKRFPHGWQIWPHAPRPASRLATARIKGVGCGRVLPRLPAGSSLRVLIEAVEFLVALGQSFRRLPGRAVCLIGCERFVRSPRRAPVCGLCAGWAAVGQAGGAKNSRAIPSGSRKETPEP